MHLAVPNLSEQDCVVLDSTAVSCSQLDETEMAEVLRIALLCTALDWTRLDYPRLKCTYVEGNDWNWTGTNRFEREGTGLDWTGRDQTPLNGLDRIKLDWSTRQRSGLDWTGLSRTAFQKTGVDGTVPNWTGLSLPELDFTRLHYTHCTTLD